MNNLTWSFRKMSRLIMVKKYDGFGFDAIDNCRISLMNRICWHRAWRAFRQCTRNSDIRQALRRSCTTEAAVESSEQADLPIYAATVLARAPILKPVLEDWEVEYRTWIDKIRARRLVPLPPEWQKAKPAEEDHKHDADSLSPDQWSEQSRITNADKAGDMKSLMRCLDRYLYFIVRQKASGGWMFPSVGLEVKETMRQTGERALKQCVGEEADVFFIANWPIAHVELTEGVSARREYYMKAQLLSGTPTPTLVSEYNDYAWVAKYELEKFLTDAKQIKKLTIALL